MKRSSLKSTIISTEKNKEADHHDILVSVVMATYNGQSFLAQQLDTIIGQTWSNLEIIIVDDVSADDTLNIIHAYQQKDNRIRVFQNEVNLGPNKSFEKGIGMARGAYVAISDQDDIWEKDKIAVMIKRWPAGAVFVYCLPGRFETDDFDSRKSITNWYHSDMNELHKLIFNTPVSGHASMFKREFFNNCIPFPKDIYYDCWMSLHAALIHGIGYIPQTLAWQRVHKKNFSLQVYKMNRTEKQAALRHQWSYFIDVFFNKHTTETPTRKSLQYYSSMLKKMDGKKFSGSMFRYILKNRKLVFHYKKRKPFALISHLKHAFRMARTGVIR